MSHKFHFIERLKKRYEKKQMILSEEKEESYYFREEPETAVEPEEELKESAEYEILEREIMPRKIKCPDCGGVTLEGLEFCDKCGGELNYRE